MTMCASGGVTWVGEGIGWAGLGGSIGVVVVRNFAATGVSEEARKGTIKFFESLESGDGIFSRPCSPCGLKEFTESV